MLCHPAIVNEDRAPAARPDCATLARAAPGNVRVSAGTASVLGLRPMKQEFVPSTAYLMVGERCRYDCGFCAQARGSKAQSGFLSRVAWPSFRWADALEAILAGYDRDLVRRCCLQVTVSTGYVQRTQQLVQDLAKAAGLPVCVSIAAPSLEIIGTLLESGAERVTLALDAACQRVFEVAKGRDWNRRINLLQQAAEEFPGHIGTHLIVGLGETEHEMLECLQEMVDRQVTVGLFAFTPVAGTAWASRTPPQVSAYRRIQAAWYLMRTHRIRQSDVVLDEEGQIKSFGLSESEMVAVLADGVAFQTAGCPDCNRPYYNERPGKSMYNYPRPLNGEEVRQALSEVLGVLA